MITVPKLIDQLYESDFYIYIGGTHFRIPRDIFSSPGDSSNFFGLNLSVNFAKGGELFPGLPREGLLRPPSIVPPNVPNHSSETFKELLHVLRGYPLHIRNDEHRQELLQDCRYYNLRGLEQKLIPHHISYNCRRDRMEIVIRIEDIKPSRLAFRPDLPTLHPSPPDAPVGYVVYGRPWVDGEDYELIVEIGGETTKFDRRDMRAEFVGQTNRRITNFLQRIADKMNLATTQPLGIVMMAHTQQTTTPPNPGNTPLSENRVKVKIERDTHIVLNGEEVEWVPWDEENAVAEDIHQQQQLGVSRPASGGSPGVTTWPPPSLPTIQSVVPPQTASPAGNRPPALATPRPLKRRRRDSTDSGSFRPGSGNGSSGGGGSGGGRGTTTPLGFSGREWIIKKGQWRVRVQKTHNLDNKGGMEVVLCAVKIEAYTSELGRNMVRGFLA